MSAKMRFDSSLFAEALKEIEKVAENNDILLNDVTEYYNIIIKTVSAYKFKHKDDIEYVNEMIKYSTEITDIYNKYKTEIDKKIDNVPVEIIKKCGAEIIDAEEYEYHTHTKFLTWNRENSLEEIKKSRYTKCYEYNGHYIKVSNDRVERLRFVIVNDFIEHPDFAGEFNNYIVYEMRNTYGDQLRDSKKLTNILCEKLVAITNANKKKQEQEHQRQQTTNANVTKAKTTKAKTTKTKVPNSKTTKQKMSETDIPQTDDTETVSPNSISQINTIESSQNIKSKRAANTIKTTKAKTTKAKTTNAKTPKAKIPHALKINVWHKWIGESIGKSKCMCCKLTDITQLKFNCGHIIAESNGGLMNINNLKPICQSCNSSMGVQNMDEFIKRCGFDEI